MVSFPFGLITGMRFQTCFAISLQESRKHVFRTKFTLSARKHWPMAAGEVCAPNCAPTLRNEAGNSGIWWCTGRPSRPAKELFSRTKPHSRPLLRPGSIPRTFIRNRPGTCFLLQFGVTRSCPDRPSDVPVSHRVSGREDPRKVGELHDAGIDLTTRFELTVTTRAPGHGRPATAARASAHCLESDIQYPSILDRPKQGDVPCTPSVRRRS